MGNNPNWPSKTGNPSGPGRGNNPPSKKQLSGIVTGRVKKLMARLWRFSCKPTVEILLLQEEVRGIVEPIMYFFAFLRISVVSFYEATDLFVLN